MVETIVLIILIAVIWYYFKVYKPRQREAEKRWRQQEEEKQQRREKTTKQVEIQKRYSIQFDKICEIIKSYTKLLTNTELVVDGYIKIESPASEISVEMQVTLVAVGEDKFFDIIAPDDFWAPRAEDMRNSALLSYGYPEELLSKETKKWTEKGYEVHICSAIYLSWCKDESEVFYCALEKIIKQRFPNYKVSKSNRGIDLRLGV